MTHLNKKGVSPLIATVLLIAFAVALGAVVMNWGRGYVEDTQDFARERSDAEITCTTDISLDVVEIDLTKQFCINSTTDPANVSMVLENRKNRDINRLEVRVIAGNGVPYTANIGNNTELDAGEARYFSFEHNQTEFGDIRQISITPVINLAGSDVACSSNQLRLIGIKDCSKVFT